MLSHHHQLPEPSLPEHELIRQADSLPELSSGLRSATMVACQIHVRQTQRMQRLKAAAMVTVAASAVFSVWAMFENTPTDGPQPVVQESPATPIPSSPSAVSPGTTTGAVISLGEPGNRDTPGEQELIDKSIEEMHRRTQKLMEAGMVPKF